MEKDAYDVNSESQKPDNKAALYASMSLVLSLISVCPSLGIIDSIRNPQGMGDFQGGGIIIILLLFGVSLLSPVGVITGMVALNKIVGNSSERLLMILAIIGIILGLPGIYSLYLFLTMVGQ